MSTRHAVSSSHLVLIPSYNPGPKVYDTVRAARAQWAPVWVVVDGSTDGTVEGLRAMAAEDANLKVLVLPENRGKGEAVQGLVQGQAQGCAVAQALQGKWRRWPHAALHWGQCWLAACALLGWSLMRQAWLARARRAAAAAAAAAAAGWRQSRRRR